MASLSESQVNDALATIYSPSASNQQRKAAQAFLDSFRSSPSALPIALSLAHPIRTPAAPPETRHYALSVIEDVVRTNWESGTLSDQDKAGIVAYAEELVQIVGGEHAAQVQQFVREKVAKVVVEVVKVAWPEMWQGLYGTVLGIYLRNTPASQDTALSILRTLCEDVFLYDDPVAARRKKHLVPPLQAMVLPASVLSEVQDSDVGEAARAMGMFGEGAVFSEWVPRLAEAAVVWAQRYEAAVDSPTPIAGGLDACECEKAAESHLRALASMVEWVPVKGLAEGKVVYRVVEVLACRSARVRVAASATLLPLLSRTPGPTPDDPLRLLVLTPLFSQGGLDLLVSSYGRAHGCPSTDLTVIREAQRRDVGEEEYAAVKGVVQAVGVVGEDHVCFKRAGGVPENFGRFVDFIQLITEHPSPTIAAMALTTWHTILKHEATCQTVEVATHLSALLETVTTLTFTLDNLSSLPPSATLRYVGMDATTSSDVRQLALAARARGLDVVKAVSAIKPLHTCVWVARKLANRMQMGVGGDALWVGMMHAEVVVFESAVKASGKMVDETIMSQYKEELAKTLSMLIAYQPTLPKVVRFVIHLTTTIAEAAGIPPDLLFPVVEKLFTYSIYVYAGEAPVTNTTRGSEARDVRMTSISALVKVGTMMPDTFMGFYDKVAEEIGRVVGGEVLTDLEKAQMVDFAMCIVYFSSYPADQKQTLFDRIVEPYIADWAAPGFAQFLTSPATFLQFLGCGQVSDVIMLVGARAEEPLTAVVDIATLTTLKQCEHTRRKLYYLVQALWMFLKRTLEVHKKTKSDDPSVVNLWLSHLWKIVPSVLGLARIIHLIWEPVNWEQYAPGLKVVLTMGNNERRLAMSLPSKPAPLDSASQTLTQHLAAFRSLLTNIREALYHILGILPFCGDEIYNDSRFLDVVIPALFPAPFCMEDRHWRILINNVLRPLIIGCPQGVFTPLLEQMLPPLFDFVGRKLDNDWKVMAEKGIQENTTETMDEDEGLDGDGNQGDEDEITDEIVNERMLRMLTGAFADLIVHIFEVKKPDPNAVKDTTEQPKKGPRATANVVAPEFLHKSLTEFILAHPIVRRPILASVLVIIMQPDSNAAKTGIRIATRLNAFLAHHIEFHEFLGKDLFSAMLKALHDPYHIEMQPVILNALTEVYSSLRPVSNIPREVLATLPQMDEGRIYDFDKEFVKKTAVKDQVQAMKSLLSKVTGVSISQWFKREDLPTLHTTRTAFLRTPQSQRKQLNGIGKLEDGEAGQDDKDAELALENLFE
ncbi:ARM repeat-containing protein [Gonapodya prolifera JEL478]|uniref:ARM repeat-containing protein n=1 Tax=Gonapodya prolifera (strain JEL478) TaxID=1344416 RepID=A0A139AMI8_GONPJ|nr:ARM repeat-containing protein [Gonapodya prolifera JEL478]|eukprot:KXS17918.1 ARM repeat-containing protein [Gonapodya prolifera JEL478]